ncbi:Uncharacterized protein OBRU01_20343 [Operophtera brumata]|uniref:Ionotropic receptor n=1 Tax=Operophtera brumata TaxID=104452 RepID=A0A0L7KXE5_OPEBR|nr:Uncharacterized protein OBRU01_20343 [Operophtera brumata]
MKNNGWNNIVTYGHLPDCYYNNIKIMPFSFITSNTDEDDYYVEDAVRYHSNTILVNSSNLSDFEESLRQVMNLPYWHPHSNIIILYHKKESKQEIARIFFILWYYKASNAIFVQYDDIKKVIFVSQYDPFVVDDSLDIFGCRTSKTINMPINTFEEGFVCEENCQNVTINSKHRRLRLGTCIGVQTHRIPYDDRNELTKINMFEDRGKNMNGFALRAFTTEVLPFILITKLENGTYELSSRDGTIWNTLAEKMNFTIDLTPSAEVLKKFNFELSIQQIFTVAQRMGDLYLTPIYQFDIIVIEVDYSFAYKDSGVCFMSHKASFETVLFDLQSLQDNIELVIEFFACVLCIWLVFFLYSVLEAERMTVDLIGKDFMNTIRSVLSITLYKPPKRRQFRYFLTIILWSFFVINFSTQAAIISFFTAFKRGKEVETFADIVEKGYKVQGMASPDVVLPDENELFRKINSKLEAISDIMGCVRAMSNDSQRFCLVDCAVGRYLERNWLNAKGEQYLHIATDRIHNYYLNFVFPKYSILTDSINKYLMAFNEAGLVKKWEQYRFNDIKEEALIKPLGMDEFNGVFKVYFSLVFVTFIIFLLELFLGNYKRIMQYWSLKVKKWKRTRIARKVIKMERKQNKITSVSSSTQT